MMVNFLVFLSVFTSLPDFKYAVSPFDLEISSKYFSPYHDFSKGIFVNFSESPSFFVSNLFSQYFVATAFNIADSSQFLKTPDSLLSPVSIYFGKIAREKSFWGISLTYAQDEEKNLYVTDVLSKRGSLLFVPSFYYSFKNSTDLLILKLSLPYLSSDYKTPTDTFQDILRGVALALFYNRNLSPQWLLYSELQAGYFSHKSSFNTIQTFSNYDSTKSQSKLSGILTLLYKPFYNTYLASFIQTSFGNDYTLFSLNFLGEYEVYPALSLKGQFSYALRSRETSFGFLRKEVWTTELLDPYLGFKFSKDFMNAEILLSPLERKIVSLIFRFKFSG